MPVVYSPERGELLVTDTPEEYYARGYREPTDEELDHAEGVAKYGGLGQQAQAQGERVIRGATLGAVPGFGAPEDIQGREEVSREEHPILSFAADVAPDVGVAALTGGLGGLATGAGRAAARGALAEGAGVLKAGLSAARAGGATALAAESLGTGLVGAGQAAHAEGSYLGEDLGRDAENVLLWGGLNFGLGAFGLRSAARLRAGAEGADELADVARAAELEGAAKNLPAEDVEAATALDSLLGGRDLSSVQQSDVPARELLRSQKLAGDAVDIEPPVGVNVGRSELPDLPESALAIPTDDVFAHANSMPVPEGTVNLVQDRLSGPLGKTPGGFFRGSDGQIRYIKADKDPAHSALEVGNANMYQALGRKTPALEIVDLQDGTRAVSSLHMGKQWTELDKLPDWSVLPASVKESYARGVPVDIIMGNWDVSRNARNIMTDGSDTLMVDAGEAATNAWSAKWFKGNEEQTAQELARTRAAGGAWNTIENPVGKAPPHELLGAVGQTEGALSGLVRQGFDDAMARIAEHGGPEEFIRAYQPTLSPEELARAASEMSHRIDALQVAIPTLGAVIYAAFDESPEGAAAAGSLGLAALLGKRGLGLARKSRAEVLSGLEKVWTAEEKQVAHGYTHARFYEVNDALRGGAPMTPEVQADLGRLESLFGKAVDSGATYQGKTLRGIGLTAEEAAQLDGAGVLTAQGFMSSSTDPKVAKQFTNFGSTSEREIPVLFEIDQVSGVPIGKGQSEIVHRPGTQFSVIGKRLEGDVPVYEVREMGYQPGAPSEGIIAGGLLGVGAASAAAGEGDSGAAAAGIGALGLLLGRRGLMGKGLRGAAARQAERAAADEGLSRAVRAASKADAEDIVKGAIGEAAEREASGFGRQRRLYQNRAPIMEAAEREFRGDLNGAMADLQRVVKGEKQAVVAAKVSANEGAQRAVASAIGKEAAEFAGALRGEARAFAKRFGKTGIQFPIPAAKSLSVALMDNASALAKAKNGKALFAALDDFKRSAQDFKLSLEQGALNSTNPIHHQQLIPRIDTFERKIRDALEDSNTWGQAGEMQRAYNGVISDKLMPSLRIFEESVMERTHRGYDGIWKMEGWENKIKGLLANTDPGRRRHAAAVFDAMDELASVRRQFGDAKTAERLTGAAAKMRRTIGLADEVSEASKAVEDLGTVAGAVPLFGGMIREAVTGRLAGAVDRLTGASDAAATRGVDDWIRSSRARAGGMRAKLPKLSELSPEAKQLRDAAVRRGVSQGMALFMGEDESPSAAFERQRDALISDEGFFESLSAEYGDVQQESPELFMALSGRAALARGFLLERMPANVAVSMARPLGHPPSREAIEDWAQYVNAVRYPTRIASNLAAISVQQVETLRTVHPRFYELLQQRMIEGLSRAQQTGEPLDDTFLMRIGLLFPDLDGAASPVFSREFGKVVRDYNQQQRQQQGQKAGAGKPGKPTPSPMLSTLQNGATFGTGF